MTDILRLPDRVLIETEAGFAPMTPVSGGFEAPCLRLTCENGVLTVLPTDRVTPGTAPRRLRLRWRGDNREVRSVYRDCWQRAVGDIGWYPVCPEQPLPWYFLTFDGAETCGCGVETGPDAFAYWQLDPMGITLWLDLRCGGEGVLLQAPLEAARLVSCRSLDGETPYRTAQRFAGLLCPRPNLPDRPIFGANNWYYAYGDITRDSVLADAALMADLADGPVRPYMVIDDGWEQNRRKGYIGGPWLPNGRFGDMAAVAAGIRERGCVPGIWMRPLLVDDETIPDALRLHRADGVRPDIGFILDPSVPEVLERIRADVSRIRSWGYDLIKHDFTCIDVTGVQDTQAGITLFPDGWHFADRTRTTAQITKTLYQTIQNAAGGAYVMGCNTWNHLTAGIHQIMRSGGDTSGRVWEITRRDGVMALAHRLHQNGRFFVTDADCAAFTPKVSTELNLQFADLVARSGTALFCSVTPGQLSPAELTRLRAIYARAQAPCDLEPLDWMHTTCPGEYADFGETRSYDWFTEWDGVRTYYTWFG